MWQYVMLLPVSIVCSYRQVYEAYIEHYVGMPKFICQAEATSKIKPITLAVIELLYLV